MNVVFGLQKWTHTKSAHSWSVVKICRDHNNFDMLLEELLQGCIVMEKAKDPERCDKEAKGNNLYVSSKTKKEGVNGS